MQPVPKAPDMKTGPLSAPILIVDDDPTSCTFIESALRDRGFNNLQLVATGQAALEAMQTFRPELVVLDINLPDINGLDCCRWIREHAPAHDIPVLMLTALNDEKLRYQSFEAGATDFVSKPLHPAELYARISVHLQNRLSMKSLREYQARLNSELDSARDLQSAVLPTTAEIQSLYLDQQIDIAAHISTSSEIGGDFWGFKMLMPGQIAVWAVDFSGHGVAAALNAFRLQAYLKEHSPLATRPGEYLSHMNEKLLNILMRGYFATMFYGVIDTISHTLHYACACAPHPIIRRTKTGGLEQLDGRGMPLGICLQFYPTHSTSFAPGDTLFLHSDALTETPNVHGEFMKDSELLTFMRASDASSVSTMMNDLYAHFTGFIGAAATDDLTLCFIQRTGGMEGVVGTGR
jgi:sigma-B regulation protein RsbU (phosphoserine phosphatase)